MRFSGDFSFVDELNPPKNVKTRRSSWFIERLASPIRPLTQSTP
jgi:hypothetical protein